MSSFSHKIDEWMKEAETRPESAVTIVKLVAKRLRELTERNEELLDRKHRPAERHTRRGIPEAHRSPGIPTGSAQASLWRGRVDAGRTPHSLC